MPERRGCRLPLSRATAGKAPPKIESPPIAWARVEREHDRRIAATALTRRQLRRKMELTRDFRTPTGEPRGHCQSAIGPPARWPSLGVGPLASIASVTGCSMSCATSRNGCGAGSTNANATAVAPPAPEPVEASNRREVGGEDLPRWRWAKAGTIEHVHDVTKKEL